MKTLTLALVLAFGCGCSAGSDTPVPGDGPDAAPPARVRAVFEPPAPGTSAAWGTIPYPSDLFLGADGTLALASLPVTDNGLPEASAMLLEALATMDGAGLWSNVYLPVTVAIDPSTLPGNVHLIDLDRDLEEVPVDLVYRADLGAIVASPVLGSLLRERTRYAAYLSVGVATVDGAPLDRSPAFSAALVAGAADPAIAAAHEHLRPLIDALPAAARDELLVATVFRTQSVSADALAMRAAILAAPPAAIAVASDEVYGPSRSELDRLFGAVVDDDPGPGMPHAGYRAQPHANIGRVVHGTIRLPSFLSPTPPEAGFPQRDAGGAFPIVGHEDARFTVVLPALDDLEHLPVVVYVTNLNRTRSDLMIQAQTAAARGMAVIGIDLPYHGDRSASRRDRLNELTGEQAPDGFGDNQGVAGASGLFHFVRSGGIPAYHPRAMRENLRQAALEVIALIDFLDRGDTGPLAAAIGAPVSFRGASVALLSESLGAMICGVVAAIEPRVAAAALSSPAAGFAFPTVAHSPSLSPAFLPLLTGPYGVGDRIVLGDPARGARLEPILMFYNAVMEPADASGYAAELVAGSLRGGSGPSVLLMEAWADERISNEATEVFAAAARLPMAPMALPVPPPGELVRFVELPDAVLPVDGNVGRRTAAMTVWYPSANAALRKADDLREYEPEFPPFVTLGEPAPIALPIAELHAQWSTFVSDAIAGEIPRVIDPFRD
jgi:hypothetical protein